MQFDRARSVFFTGHRPPDLWGVYDPPPYFRPLTLQVQATADVISSAVGAGYRNFISGGALGFDQMAASTVITLRDMSPTPEFRGIKLIIARPFPSQASRWPPKTQGYYQELLNHADIIVDVSRDPYSAEKMMIRNRWMVDNAAVGIAMWNGKTSGGTYDCIKYATSQGKPVNAIHPKTYAITRVELPYG